MKKRLLLLVLFLSSNYFMAQGYEFGIVHIGGFDFKVVAIPDFDSGGNTDISDVGFTIMLPAGSYDVTVVIPLLGGRAWDTTEYNAAFLSGLTLGDGTKDAWAFNLPPGQTMMAHTNGQQIDLVSFTVSNSPASGVMSLLDNADPIAAGAGGVLDSFYNSNIDNSTTQDYFAGIASGMGDFDFATLSAEEREFINALRIYPNPASEFIYIRSSQPLNQVVLYNLTGERILKTTYTEKLDVGALASGVYFIEVTSIDNYSATRKIVIE